MFEFGTMVALMVRIRWYILKVSPYSLFPGEPTNSFQVLRIENGIRSSV